MNVVPEVRVTLPLAGAVKVPQSTTIKVRKIAYKFIHLLEVMQFPVRS